MKKLTTVIAVAALAASGITIAGADPFLEVRSETVGFPDLDTSNAHGAAMLYHRLKIAAKSVCRDLEPERQLGLEPVYRELRASGHRRCDHEDQPPCRHRLCGSPGIPTQRCGGQNRTQPVSIYIDRFRIFSYRFQDPGNRLRDTDRAQHPRRHSCRNS